MGGAGKIKVAQNQTEWALYSLSTVRGIKLHPRRRNFL